MTFDLAQIGAGFSDASFGSQAVFRRCLEALASPATIVEVPADAHVPEGLHSAASALLLALLDQDTRLWISPSLKATSAQAFLRFHTGCEIVDAPASADFGVVHNAREFPALGQFSLGSEEYPDRSATLVLQTDSLRNGAGWTLSGPGILGKGRLAVGGLDDRFLAQWAANRRLFPRGVDLFIACGNRLAGIPRTTRIEG